MGADFSGDGESNKKKLALSLHAIKAAKKELSLLAEQNQTQLQLVSQIELCEILLGEIGVVHACLVGRVGGVSRRSGRRRRYRSGRYSAVCRMESGRSRLGHRG
jgi:hypothetical protein